MTNASRTRDSDTTPQENTEYLNEEGESCAARSWY